MFGESFKNKISKIIGVGTIATASLVTPVESSANINQIENFEPIATIEKLQDNPEIVKRLHELEDSLNVKFRELLASNGFEKINLFTEADEYDKEIKIEIEFMVPSSNGVLSVDPKTGEVIGQGFEIAKTITIETGKDTLENSSKYLLADDLQERLIKVINDELVTSLNQSN